MTHPQLIGPIPRSTPAEQQLARGQRRGLPDDVLREASRRLGIISLLGAALWTVAPVLGHLVGRAEGALDPHEEPDPVLFHQP